MKRLTHYLDEVIKMSNEVKQSCRSKQGNTHIELAILSKLGQAHDCLRDVKNYMYRLKEREEE